MTILKEQVPRKDDPALLAPNSVESLLGSGLSIEGTVNGVGHVRIAGQFRGDVKVDGNLAIEPGARVVAGVVADAVTVAGELEGNIDSATKVELLASGVLTGDLKAGSLIVAAGSRMRGRAEFGWPDAATAALRPGLKAEPDTKS
jgi:cytoskeletal protein CcmA (bactofilin family)